MSEPTSEARPEITVIVPVFNGGEMLRKCLDGIFSQREASFECIVVDDASTDGEASRLAGKFGARYFRLERQQGPAAARNIGAEHALGDILFFTDADVILAPDALSRSASTLAAGSDYEAVFGSYDDQPADPGFLSQFRNLYHHWNHHQAGTEASTFWTGCGAVRRATFLAVGGFNTLYSKPSIEDIELGYRLRSAGHRIRLDAKMQGRHLKQWTLTGMVRTDVFQRGVPWIVLLRRFPESPADLNLNVRARLATVAACLLVLTLLVLAALDLRALTPFLFLFFTSCTLTALSRSRLSREKTSVLNVFGSLILIGTAALVYWSSTPWSVLPLVFIALGVACEAGFFGLLHRQRGWGFALAAWPAHWLFFLSCAAAVPLGLLASVQPLKENVSP